MQRDPYGLTPEQILEEARELGADGPQILESGALVLSAADAQAVFASARRARLGESALRKAVAQIPGEPLRFKAAELRLAVRTLERRLAHVEPEVARLKAAGQDRGHPHAELAATVLALARLRADLVSLGG
jgi:hypothetical protein